jgi:hypothetical protein
VVQKLRSKITYILLVYGTPLQCTKEKNRRIKATGGEPAGEAPMPKLVFERRNISNKKLERARVAITQMWRSDLHFIGMEQS